MDLLLVVEVVVELQLLVQIELVEEPEEPEEPEHLMKFQDLQLQEQVVVEVVVKVAQEQLE